MKCQHCEKVFSYKTQVKVMKKAKGYTRIAFCCYECYLAFWEDIKGFVPFKEYKPIEKHKRNLRKKQHSYDKNAYCY